MKKPLKKVLIMAGGTGGHVFPGLAVAHYLKTQGVEVHWLGTKQGLEASLVPEADIPLHMIRINGLRGKGAKIFLAAPFKILAAIWQSLKIIKKINPDMVVGMGGFASGPGGAAAFLSGKPLVIHEQNARAGMTNKLLAHAAKRVLQGFPGSFAPQSKLLHIGNPVREEIENLPPPQMRGHQSNQRLLVLGGSLGAQALNNIVPYAIAQLKPQERPELWHQTGEKHFEAVKKIYEELGLNSDKIKIVPFIKDMAHAYGWANMVLCRAGALTVAELCTAGLGAIFVPFPHAVDDHQTANADFMVRRHAAVCIQQKELTDSRLAEVIQAFSASPEKRFAMAQAAYQLRKVNVAKQFYEILCEVMGSSRG